MKAPLLPLLFAVVLAARVHAGPADSTSLSMQCAGRLDFPMATGAAYDADGSLYAWSMDGGTVGRFGTDGTLLASWDGASSDPEIALTPLSVAGDGQGAVYVSNYALHRVECYSRAGHWVGNLGGEVLTSPIGLAVDRRNGRIVVIDRSGGAAAGRVCVFPPGQMWFSFSADHWPVALAVDGAGDIYVAGLSGTVEKRGESGALLAGWTLPGAGPDVRFTALALSPGGRVHVLDEGTGHVYVLSPELALVGAWDLSCVTGGNCPAGYGRYWGVAIDAQGNAALARECLSENIQLFRPNGTVPTRAVTWGALKAIYR